MGAPRANRRALGLGLLVAVVTAALLRAIGFEEVFLDDDSVVFFFGDAFYHARRALWSFENFPRVLLFDSCINFPDGSVIPHPPLLDWIVAAAARALGTSRTVFEHTAAWSPVVFGALTVLPVYALGAAFGRRGAGLGAAFLYAALPIPVMYARVGNADHHAAAGLFGAAFLALVAFALDPQRRGRELAILHASLVPVRAALLGTWTGSLLYLGLGELALALAGVLSGRRDRLLGQAAGCLATAALLAPVVALSPVPNGGLASATELSWLHVAFYAAAAAVCGGSAALQAFRPTAQAWVRLARAGVLAALVLLLVLALPGFLEGVLRAAGFLARADDYTGLVVEQLPLFWEQGELRAAAGERRMGYYAYLLPFTPLVWLLVPGRPELQARRHLLFAWSVIFGYLALQQFRYVHDLAPAACLAFALALAEGARWLRERGVARRTAAGLAVALGTLLLAPAAVRYYAPNLEPVRAHLLGRLTGVDRALLSIGGTQLRFAQAVAALTPPTPGCDGSEDVPAYGILAHPAIGHVLHYTGQRATPADPFGPYIGRENFARAVRFLMTDDEEEAVAIAEALRTPFVVTAEEGGDAASASMAHRLHRDDGSKVGEADHLGRFRLVVEGPPGGIPISVVFESGLRSTLPYKLFELVAGGVLEARAEPGAEVDARLPIVTSSGRRFLFRASGVADDTGLARLRVPYATERTGPTRALAPYHVHTGQALVRVDVPEDAVRSGAVLRVADP
jgi:dolichyl-phosphooligosaccharide-protein glycotransferase